MKLLLDSCVWGKAAACLNAVTLYAAVLEQRGIVTVEPGRVRVRPATNEEAWARMDPKTGAQLIKPRKPSAGREK